MPQPLASKIRPKSLDEFQGQEHLVGKDKPLRAATEQKHLFSFILWGPPGCGKTTLAKIYANALDAEFFELSAVSAGKADIKKIIAEEWLKSRLLSVRSLLAPQPRCQTACPSRFSAWTAPDRPDRGVRGKSFAVRFPGSL